MTVSFDTCIINVLITVINDVFIFTVTISRAEIYDKFKETDFIPLDFTLVSIFTRARQEHF